MVIFSTFGTVGTFGTPVAFGTLRIRSVFSTLGIIPSEFLYILWTLVHLTFRTLVGTLYQLVYSVFSWYSRIDISHFRYVYVW